MAGPFREGRARVARAGRWGHIDTHGEFVTAPQFDMALEFFEGLAAVDFGTSDSHRAVADALETGFIDRTGKFQIAPRFLSAGAFRGGFCLVEDEKNLLYIDRLDKALWASGWADIGGFDPLHLLPPETVEGAAIRLTERSVQ
jgi:hypothetical protein